MLSLFRVCFKSILSKYDFFLIGQQALNMLSNIRLKKNKLLLKEQSLTSVLLLLILQITLVTCESNRTKEFNEGQQSLQDRDIRLASTIFERIVQKEGTSDQAIKATRELVKIYLYEFKDYDKTINKLRFLVLNSKESNERLKAQKQIAQIFFDNKAQYENAVIEFSRLLVMPISKEESINIRLSVARAYYHMGNFEQSWREVFSLSSVENIQVNKVYDIKLLQANIKMAQKEHSSAARIYEDLLSNFSARANKENIPLSLSLCYEVEEDFEKAIEILKPLISVYKPAEFITLKIKKLTERQQNKPKKRVKK